MKTTAMFVFLSCAPALAGDLNPPPGPVAPSMKTLDEVEPRVALSQENTPGDADSVFRIDAPGSYYLAGPLSHGAGLSAIEIASDDVSIDLRGFEITGVPSSLDAVRAGGAFFSGLSISNGSIGGAGGAGLALANVSSIVVDRVRVSGVGGDGINVGGSSVVLNSSVIGAGGFGIRVSTGRIEGCSVGNAGPGMPCFEIACCGSITDCQATGSTGVGFNLQSDIVARGCVATGTLGGFAAPGGGVIFRDCNSNFCNGAGFTGGGSTVYEGCVARGSNGSGFVSNGPAVFTGCIAQDCSARGFSVSDNTELTECVSSSNMFSGFSAGDSCSLTSCTSEGNASGISSHGFVIGNGSTLTACAARENTGHGFLLDAGTSITNCSATQNGTIGFWIPTGCSAIGCSARLNGEEGFMVFNGSAVESCSADLNGLDGFTLSFGVLIRGCSAARNGEDGISPGPYCRVVDNTCNENELAGIRTGSNRVYIDGNTVTNNGTSGIELTFSSGGGSVVTNNVAMFNTTNYSITPGNHVGTIRTSPLGAGPLDNFDY